MNAMKQELGENDYHISVGMAMRKENQTVHELSESVEKLMYKDKENFYKQSKNDRRRRNMDKKLENILLDKRDQDNFLSVISSYFLGAYMVNLDTDQTRAIYKPEYFDRMLIKHDYKFSASMKEYSQELIIPADQDKVEDLLNYDIVASNIAHERIMNFVYGKVDGKRVRIRVIPASNYSEEERDTIWIFENSN